MTTEIKLTQYSKGGGCGCKIAPAVLQEIVKTNSLFSSPELLVGNESADDAAVYQIDDENAVISTTDFFMPIVDDPYTFGRIAAANAISDVYAMGGTPLMAIAILGWPIDRLPKDTAQQVLEGGRSICKEAGIPLAGGHTIDSSDPIFGLAVTGKVEVANLKQNNTARDGDLLLLTKPVGVGAMATAIKRGLLKSGHYDALVKQLTTLNKDGEALGKLDAVHAMTDVTGFGVLGHLIEMAEGSGLSAVINFNEVRQIEGLQEYLALKTIPGATSRNWNSYGHKVTFQNPSLQVQAQPVLTDPQTNGGLLIAVDPASVDEVRSLLGEKAFIIGKLTSRKDNVVTVQ